MLRLRSSRNSIVLFQNYALEQASELQLSVQSCHRVKYNWYDDDVITTTTCNIIRTRPPCDFKSFSLVSKINGWIVKRDIMDINN